MELISLLLEIPGQTRMASQLLLAFDHQLLLALINFELVQILMRVFARLTGNIQSILVNSYAARVEKLSCKLSLYTTLILIDHSAE
jgi:hypothetical protein